MNYLKYINSRIILAMVISTIMVFGMTSCKKDDEESGKIELLSFGPTGVEHGDVIQFIGKNLKGVNSIMFAGGAEVASTGFVSWSGTVIEIAVPEAAEAGRVTLKTDQGDIMSKAMISFEVPVVITSITPEAKPGTNITITGNYLNWIESVSFYEDLVVEADDFVSASLTEVVLTVPMAAQTDYLTIASGGTEPMTIKSENVLTVTMPTITSIAPLSIKHTDELTITGTDLDLVTSVIFPGDFTVTEFVSQSATELVVAVPVGTEDGNVTITQHSPLNVTSTEAIYIILPAATDLSPSPATPGTDNITITGTNLDLVASLTLPVDIVVDAASFVSQSATEIVVALPAEATAGGVAYTTIHGFSGALGVLIKLPGAGPSPLLIPVYEDAVEAGWGQGGGWNATTEWGSIENARTGDNSIKITYQGSWGGGAQFGTWGNPDFSITGAEVFSFSIFGTAENDGAGIRAVIKGEGSQYDIDLAGIIVAGQWVDVEIPVADFGGVSTVTEIFFQDMGFSGVVYIDRIGFDKASGPPALAVGVYEDAIGSGFIAGGWGADIVEHGSEDYARSGSNSVKVSYAGGWSALQFEAADYDNPPSVAGTSVLAFSVYGTPESDGGQLKLILQDQTGAQHAIDGVVTMVNGEWVDVEIPLDQLGSATGIQQLAFQDMGVSGVVYIDHIGFR